MTFAQPGLLQWLTPTRLSPINNNKIVKTQFKNKQQVVEMPLFLDLIFIGILGPENQLLEEKKYKFMLSRTSLVHTW